MLYEPLRCLCVPLLVLAVTVAMTSAQGPPVLPSFVPGGLGYACSDIDSYYGSGGLPASFYLFPEASAAAPGILYVFRQTAELAGSTVSNQRPILGAGGSSGIREVVIVVVPSGAVTTELLTENQVLDSGYAIVPVPSTFCDCPIVPSGFSYAQASDAVAYPTVHALLFNGSNTSYIQFGFLSNATMQGKIYMQLSSSNDTVLGYLLDSIPGDLNFAYMRRLFSLTTETLVTTLDGLAGLILSDTGAIYNVAGVTVSTPNVLASKNYQLHSGFENGNPVFFYIFNASRVTSGAAQVTGITPNRMYLIAGQDVPVVDSTIGSPEYSDMWALVRVASNMTDANVTWPITSLSAIPSAWSTTFTGTYINCPIVGVNATLTGLDLQPSAASSISLYYRGTTLQCLNFSQVPGCAIKPVYRLQNATDGTAIDGNDIFTVSPIDSLRYTPYSWLMTVATPAAYSTTTGEWTAVSNMPSPLPSPSAANGVFMNAPIISVATALRPVSTYASAFNYTGADGLSSFELAWTVLGDRLDVHVACTGCHGYIALGFGGASTHEGLFVAGYIENTTGSACIQEFLGTSYGYGALTQESSLLNLSSPAIAFDGFERVQFQFSRAVTLTQDPVNASVRAGSNNRLTVSMRRTRLASCAWPSPIARHDFVFNTYNQTWDTPGHSSTTGAIELLQAPTSVSPLYMEPQATDVLLLATPPVVTTPNPYPIASNASTDIVTGEFICDGNMAFSWSLNLTALNITFSVTMPGEFVGWFGLGLGSQMALADIWTVYRSPDDEVVVGDRKGIGDTLPPLDVEQNVDLISASITSASSTFVIRRFLNTGDHHDSAQPRARTVLAAQSIPYSSGWVNGASVGYYAFNNGPSFGTQNDTATATMYLMRNATTLTTDGTWQRSLIDRVPGQAGYSDLWSVMYVDVPGDFLGPEVRSTDDIPSSWVMTPSPDRLNCVVVNSGTQLSDSSIPSIPLWYRYTLQKCFNFEASVYAVNPVPQQALLLVANGTNETVDALFDAAPGDAGYSSFVWVHTALVPNSYIPGMWTSLDSFLTSSGYTITAAGYHANFPLFPIQNLTGGTGSPAPNPGSAVDPAWIASYAYSMVLATYADGSPVVQLYWNYEPSTTTLSVMVVGFQIPGYVAIGFSSVNNLEMADADIVLGYVNSQTGSGCVRVLYSLYEISAPSQTATMVIDDASVTYSSGGATILRFQRAFDANAHPAGVIPTPSQGATSRVIYATLQSALSLNCSASASFAPLYHGTSPHGSVVVNWLGETAAPTSSSVTGPPAVPPVSPPSPPVLVQQNFNRQYVWYNSFSVPVYCLVSLSGVSLGATTVSTPTLYVIVYEDGSEAQFPVAMSTVGMPNYSGVWSVVFVEVPSMWTTPVTSASTIEELLSSSSLRQFVNGSSYASCPVVEAQSTVEPEDREAYPMWTVYFDSQLFSCFFMGWSSTAPRIASMWNSSVQTAPVVDTLTQPFRRQIWLTEATAAFTSAAALSAQSAVPTTTVLACFVVASALSSALEGDGSVPPSATYTTLTGYFNSRQVTYFGLKPTITYATEYHLSTATLFLLRNGSSVDSPSARSGDDMIADVLPGNGTYSDIWQLTVVDVSSLLVGADASPNISSLTSTSALLSFPQSDTAIFLNCPIVNAETTFEGYDAYSIRFSTIWVAGQPVRCANFGFVPSPPSPLPRIYDVYFAASSTVQSTVLTTVPGVSDFFPVMWHVSFTALSPPANGIYSFDDLNSTAGDASATYTLVNVFVVSVAMGDALTETVPLNISAAAVQRFSTDYTALMSGPIVTDISTLYDGSIAAAATSVVYVFREGLTVESNPVASQLPVIHYAPNEVAYSVPSGSYGYTDLHNVVVVTPVGNWTSSAIGTLTSATAINNALAAGSVALNTSTGVQSTIFVSTNGSTLSGASSVYCHATFVSWSGSQLPAVECGLFTPVTTTAILDGADTYPLSESDALRSRDAVGMSQFDSFPLNAGITSLLFNPIRERVFSQGHPSTAYILGQSSSPLNETGRGVVYVFRLGPSLYGSASAPLSPVLDPVNVSADGVPVFLNVYDVVVVNVGSSDESAVAAFAGSITSVSALLALLETNCWSLQETSMSYVGRIILPSVPNTNTLPMIEGITAEPIYAAGSEYIFVISSVVSSSIALDPSNAALAVFSTATGLLSHFVLPTSTLEGSRGSALRSVYVLNVTEPMAYLTVNSSVMTGAVPAGTALIYLSFVSLREYVTPPPPVAYSRSTGYYDRRLVYFYNMGTSSTATGVDTSVPIYQILYVSASSNLILSTGISVITLLPGNVGYTDVHTYFECRVSEGSAFSPLSEVDILLGLANGSISACTASSTHNVVIVNSATTVEEQDLYDSNRNPYGVQLVTVLFDGTVYGGLDFGPVQQPFLPGSSLNDVVLTFGNTSGALIEAQPFLFAFAEPLSGAMTASVFKQGVFVFVPDSYVGGTATTLEGSLRGALNTEYTGLIFNLPVMAVEAPVPPILYDDTTIVTGMMSMIWAYGPLAAVPPMDLLMHTQAGTTTVNFFTGESADVFNSTDALLSPTSVHLGNNFILSWCLRAPSRRRSGAYPLADTSLVLTLQSFTDTWVAIGFSATGLMPGSLSYVAYASAAATPNVQLTERYATGYSLPQVQEDTIVMLESYQIYGNSSGFTVTFSRPLIPSNASQQVIVDGPMEVVWAQGPWDFINNVPSMHTAQGSLQINFLATGPVPFNGRIVSWWYIEVLAVCILAVLISTILLHVLPPGPGPACFAYVNVGVFLFFRPFSACAAAGGLFRLVLAQWLLVLVMAVALATWIVGNYLDLATSQYDNASWLAVGNGAQLVLCVVFLPLPRNNPLLFLFATTFNKVRGWFQMLLTALLALSWIHGVGMLALAPIDPSSPSWWSGLTAWIFITLYFTTASGIVYVPAYIAYYMNWLIALGIIVFVCIHQVGTAYGLVPTFLVFILDWALRLKDHTSRSGEVRSYALTTKNCVAIEFAVSSPWQVRGWNRPFKARPASIVFVHLEGWRHPVPVQISSRVTQEPPSNRATFTVHVKGSSTDTILAMNAARNKTKSAKSFEECVLAAAYQRNLGNRSALFEGPYGGLHISLRFYRTLLCVCGGVGITSALPVLDSLVHDTDYYRRTSVVAVRLLWVVREPEDLLVFADDLLAIISSALPFNLQLFFFATRMDAIGSTSGIIHELDLTPGRLPSSTDHIAAASVGGAAEEEMEEITPLKDAADDTEIPPPTRYSPMRSRGSAMKAIPNHPLLQLVKVHGGRPQLIHFFSQQKTEALSTNQGCVAVQVSVPRGMVIDVMTAADACQDRSLQFHLDVQRLDTLDVTAE